MATVQSTFPSTIPVGYPGQVANGETANRITRTVEDSAGIAFGKAAFRGTGDHGVTATPGAGAFMGVVVADHALGAAIGGTADTVPQYSAATLLNEGVVWVTAGANTTDGAAAYVTSGGAFTPTSASNTAIPAVFDDTVSSGAVVRLRVRRA